MEPGKFLAILYLLCRQQLWRQENSWLFSICSVDNIMEPGKFLAILYLLCRQQLWSQDSYWLPATLLIDNNYDLWRNVVYSQLKL
jgi:hypothetical protein